MLEYLYSFLLFILAVWILQALALAVWGAPNGSRFLPSLLAGLLLGPLVGGLLIGWRGRLHRWRQTWRTHDGPSLFVEDKEGLYCRFNVNEVNGGLAAHRRVYWQVPGGEAPTPGWPVVLLFHGTAHPAQLFFGARRGAPFGGYHQTRATIELLESGYAVIAPDALGRIGWMTNLWPFSRHWGFAGNPDRRFLRALFQDLKAGEFGPIDETRWYATGISSGGYMASRMALSYRSRFRAIAVVAAAYATCLGRLGRMPANMPADHPPTLFIHGQQDRLAPFSRMQDYRKRLEEARVDTQLVEDAHAGHAWLAGSGQALVQWFDSHR